MLTSSLQVESQSTHYATVLANSESRLASTLMQVMLNDGLVLSFNDFEVLAAAKRK